MALLDAVQQHLGASEVNQISQQLGISQAQAQTAISSALPALLGGMAGHASQAQGADAVQQAIGAHEGATDNVMGLLGAGGAADGGGLLGKILGGHRDTVQQGVQQASGLDSEKTRKLLMMLAPIVLGVLARKQFGGATAGTAPQQQQQQQSGGGLGGMLQKEAQAAARQSPHLGGLLGKILGAVQTNG
jgi:hypothetical protein